MKIKIKNGKWNESGILLDLFINTKRESVKPVQRWIPTKEHNYEFAWKY